MVNFHKFSIVIFLHEVQVQDTYSLGRSKKVQQVLSKLEYFCTT